METLRPNNRITTRSEERAAAPRARPLSPQPPKYTQPHDPAPSPRPRDPVSRPLHGMGEDARGGGVQSRGQQHPGVHARRSAGGAGGDRSCGGQRQWLPAAGGGDCGAVRGRPGSGHDRGGHRGGELPRARRAARAGGRDPGRASRLRPAPWRGAAVRRAHRPVRSGVRRAVRAGSGSRAPRDDAADESDRDHVAAQSDRRPRGSRGARRDRPDRRAGRGARRGGRGLQGRHGRHDPSGRGARRRVRHDEQPHQVVPACRACAPAG